MEKSVFEVTFLDGEKRVVSEVTYSRAMVLAAYQRMTEGAASRRALHVFSGKRLLTERERDD